LQYTLGMSVNDEGQDETTERPRCNLQSILLYERTAYNLLRDTDKENEKGAYSAIKLALRERYGIQKTQGGFNLI
jgi:hypothetical protein